ncbi:MAG: iron-regulated protein [Marinilabiliales bacterium]|nr:MAG: iron-regulated protein [Marinilabiliales bacterium]
MKTLAKYHKWISIIFTLFIVLFSISGIVLNHRNLLSGIDLNRSLLPKEFSYNNWNNAAVKSTLRINSDSVLIYGNIGVWLTDNKFTNYSDFNHGFPQGIDNRKVNKIIQTNHNKLLAGTLFGLYQFKSGKWERLDLPVKKERISDLIVKEDTVFVLTRSYLLKTKDLKHFETITLPPPVNYDNKIGLFKTLWVIHSGEIYGEAGKLLVDIVGLIMMFLTITGFILFVNRLVLKKRKKIVRSKRRKIKRSNKFLLKWHNKIGWTTLVLLIITSSTGIFLRPPFLISIVNTKVSKIPFSELDTDNAWFDKLRRVMYDDETHRYLVSTSEGMFYSDDNFKSELKTFRIQPPISIMGLNVFEKIESQKYLIGSFEGLFLWDAGTGYVFDLITNNSYQRPKAKSRPIGQYLISGFTRDYHGEITFFDYNIGAHTISGNPFPKMPENIQKQPISLWNTALEIHTGRIFQSLLKDFYILIVPLTGIALLFILISGFIVWFKCFRKKRKKIKNE